MMRTQPTAAAVVIAAVLAALTSCSSDGDPAADQPSEPAAQTSEDPAPPTPTPTPSPSPSPSPSLPEPADGENAEACADGTCEIRVTEGASLPVPQSFGLGPIEVISVNEEEVQLFGPMTQSRYSSDGGCSMSITGPTATSPGFLGLTCPAGNTGIINDAMSLEVVGILDAAAVLRIQPAD
ncbi:hypothetical protein [Streptomyces litchfieldiae]|uniref:Lipoprotein n=1 Tax=Streptomyces litchfieldiae TaxID=3075543 RepID=A0ABU2MZD0_9ACTN|nr:hypothetical protein [Streptomyces sp. DSM 44938]MDT0347013.1 hypothetical protein [Streptomyces sp. DSM 44938]